jgi:D-sedoheptulose 7-phosphate isomerase
MSVEHVEDEYVPDANRSPDTARDYVAVSHKVLDAIPFGAVERLALCILTTTIEDHWVYVFGNGGSAATAAHIACDLNNNTGVAGAPKVRCLPLGLTVATTSAIANDLSYSMVFADELRRCGRPGDLALAVSTSGNSQNVLEGLTVARQLGMRTAALLGFHGGAAVSMVDIPVVVRSESVPHLEDAHNNINHMLTGLLRGHLGAHVAEDQVLQSLVL